MKNYNDTGDFDMSREPAQWCVYIIYCSDESLYTGISTDFNRRFRQHGRLQGAKYFRGRQPKQLVYLENGHTRSSASKREAVIKRMPRRQKLKLLEAESNDIKNHLKEIIIR